MPGQGLPGETSARFYCETKGTGMTPITIIPQPHHLSQGRWNLLRDNDGALYLLVQCEASFVSFERLVMLDEIELEDYRGLGWLSLQHLASRISYFATQYADRSVTGERLQRALEVTRSGSANDS